jgi:hypothetical protein
MIYTFQIHHGSTRHLLHFFGIQTLGELQIEILYKLNIPISKVYSVIHNKGTFGYGLSFHDNISTLGQDRVLTILANELGVNSPHMGTISSFVDYVMLTLAGLSQDTVSTGLKHHGSDLVRQYINELENSAQRVVSSPFVPPVLDQVPQRTARRERLPQSDRRQRSEILQRPEILQRSEIVQDRPEFEAVEEHFVINGETNGITPIGTSVINNLEEDSYLEAIRQLSLALATDPFNYEQNQELMPSYGGVFQNVPITITEEEFERVSDSLPRRVNAEQTYIQTNEDKCSICLGELGNTNIRRLLVCNHEFHHNCIKRQLVDFNCRCPTCRADVRDVLNSTGLTQTDR